MQAHTKHESAPQSRVEDKDLSRSNVRPGRMLDEIPTLTRSWVVVEEADRDRRLADQGYVRLPNGKLVPI